MQRFLRSTKCGRGRRHRRRTNSARISHPPPFRRMTKNVECHSKPLDSIAGIDARTMHDIKHVHSSQPRIFVKIMHT